MAIASSVCIVLRGKGWLRSFFVGGGEVGVNDIDVGD